MTNNARSGGYLRFPLLLSGSCRFEIRKRTAAVRVLLSCHVQLALPYYSYSPLGYQLQFTNKIIEPALALDIAAYNFDYHQTAAGAGLLRALGTGPRMFADKQRRRVVTMSREHAFIIRSRDKLTKIQEQR